VPIDGVERTQYTPEAVAESSNKRLEILHGRRGMHSSLLESNQGQLSLSFSPSTTLITFLDELAVAIGLHLMKANPRSDLHYHMHQYDRQRFEMKVLQSHR
jgi:hypothetical protein